MASPDLFSEIDFDKAITNEVNSGGGSIDIRRILNYENFPMSIQDHKEDFGCISVKNQVIECICPDDKNINTKDEIQCLKDTMTELWRHSNSTQKNFCVIGKSFAYIDRFPWAFVYESYTDAQSEMRISLKDLCEGERNKGKWIISKQMHNQLKDYAKFNEIISKCKYPPVVYFFSRVSANDIKCSTDIKNAIKFIGRYELQISDSLFYRRFIFKKVSADFNRMSLIDTFEEGEYISALANSNEPITITYEPPYQSFSSSDRDSKLVIRYNPVTDEFTYSGWDLTDLEVDKYKNFMKDTNRIERFFDRSIVGNENEEESPNYFVDYWIETIWGKKHKKIHVRVKRQEDNDVDNKLQSIFPFLPDVTQQTT